VLQGSCQLRTSFSGLHAALQTEHGNLYIMECAVYAVD
jgi:hypothetical protein